MEAWPKNIHPARTVCCSDAQRVQSLWVVASCSDLNALKENTYIFNVSRDESSYFLLPQQEGCCVFRFKKEVCTTAGSRFWVREQHQERRGLDFFFVKMGGGGGGSAPVVPSGSNVTTAAANSTLARPVPAPSPPPPPPPSPSFYQPQFETAKYFTFIFFGLSIFVIFVFLTFILCHIYRRVRSHLMRNQRQEV